MKHELGTIKIHAEIQENPENRIQCFQDITRKYKILGEKQKEHLYAVFLKKDHQFIGDQLIGLGDCDTVKFELKDIVRTAALVNAAAVILIHNHPSGHAEPTETDIETTQDVHNALDQIGVQLLDHVIITQENDYSMRGENDGPF